MVAGCCAGCRGSNGAVLGVSCVLITAAAALQAACIGGEVLVAGLRAQAPHHTALTLTDAEQTHPSCHAKGQNTSGRVKSGVAWHWRPCLLVCYVAFSQEIYTF